MINPDGQQEQRRGAAGKRLKTNYFSKKLEYLELCWNYNLKPRSLRLTDMAGSDIESGDRQRLIRLVMALSDMEKLFKPGEIKNNLFARDDSRFMESELFGPRYN